MRALSKLFPFFALLTLTAAAGCAAADQPDVEQGGGAVSASPEDARLLDVPFYFSVPKSVVTTELNRKAYPYPTVWNPSTEVQDAGLRIIAVKQAGKTPAAKRAARIEMAQKLAKAGVLQDGDLALTFRPELQGTLAYAHVQMGTTHASLVYTKDGQAYNVDSPLNNEYVGQFSTLHFAGGTTASGTVDNGTDALHIIRPIGFDDARRARLQKWASSIAKSRGFGKVRFQSDYLNPIFAASNMTTTQTVTHLGKIILGQGTVDLPMYCSEFAWHMLALSNCSEAEIRDAGPEGAACVKPVFTPMKMVAKSPTEIGLAEGPLVSLLAAPEEERGDLIKQVFSSGDPARLSSGHRAVAEKIAPFMTQLAQYYGARLQGAPAGIAAETDTSIPNYSPTAFVVDATQPAGVRHLDYVATVVFVDSDADLAKAKRLAMPTGTSVPE